MLVGTFKPFVLNSNTHEKKGDLIIYNRSGDHSKVIKPQKEMGCSLQLVVGYHSKRIQIPTIIHALEIKLILFSVVIADGFIARDMTFQNTAGPQMHQAVALRSSSDHSIFYRCSFKGYQDTLYVHSQRQFYRDCDIYGTIDFIFGYAAAIFQNCNIYVRRPMIYQQNSVTAHGRSDPNENTGIVIHHSRIVAAPDLWPAQGSFKTFLGRPWMNYSRTVIMKTYIGSLIDPAGWVEWIGDFGLSTLYFGEYMNRGGGAHTGRRVKWPGYHILVTAAEARNFSARSFLHGDGWIPATGVPYISGL
ncbi:pectinesterase 2-like [Magnolia sinica]|uniref:pectinesterase 2-like n=1 Tax=Magnolia sinica TaxID=86752 RepID=UPI00265B190E|nr:pectinesterase 2-like [Magnolia sinica]